MKRMITIAFMMTVVVMMAHAQGALKLCRFRREGYGGEQGGER